MGLAVELLLDALEELHDALKVFVTREGDRELTLARSGAAEGNL